jgi:4-amino-4-deoxy-L-arabinose transferase-like glycosyltransferase
VVALTAFGLRIVNIGPAWDIFVDEITYVRIGTTLLETGRMSLYGAPFYLHPPLFFVLEGLYLRVLHPASDLIGQIYAVRAMNAVLAAISAAALFWIGRSMAGWRAGLLAALLFALDSFVVRLNSRVLLETLEVMWVLLGYCSLFGTGCLRWPIQPGWRAAWAGVAFGLALLTKDLAALVTILPLGTCWVLGWALPRRTSAVVVGTAVGTYLLHPLHVAAIGDLRVFLDHTLAGLERFAGFAQTTGFHRPGGQPFSAAVVANLDQFGATYALLAVGAAATVTLFLTRDRRARLLAIWSGSGYAATAFSVGFGTLEEQFFYPAIVSAMLATAIAIVLWSRPTTTTANGRGRPWRHHAAGAVVVPFVLWSALLWYRIHSTPDNAYEQLRAYVRANVPDGSRVAATTETSVFLFDGPDVAQVGTIDGFRRDGIEYVVASSLQVERGYGYLSEEAYDWVRTNGHEVFGVDGRTNGHLGLYRLPKQF